jgi:hypothetical protein
MYDISRSQWPRGLRRGSAAARLLGLWFRIPPGHGCLSLVSIVCCHLEVFAKGWSLAQRSPTECDSEASIERGPWPNRGRCAMNRRIRCMKSTPQMRFSLFWDVTRRRLAFIYRRFGTNYPSHLQVSSSFWRWDRYVVPKRRLISTNLRRVKCQKSEDLVLTAAEAWNRASTPQVFKIFLCLAKTSDAVVSTNYVQVTWVYLLFTVAPCCIGIFFDTPVGLVALVR